VAWIARLDTRSRRWPTILRALYVAWKWTFVALGAYILIGMGISQAREGRVGLGFAFLIYLVYTVVWWLVDHRHLPSRHHRS